MRYISGSIRRSPVPMSGRSCSGNFRRASSTSSSSTSATVAAPRRTPRGARFSSTSPRATQIGMTATPKGTKYVSNIALLRRAGLQLLAQAGYPRWLPRSYKVVKVHIDRDVEGYRPERARWTVRPRSRRPHLQPAGLRPQTRHRRANETGRSEGLGVPQRERRPLSEDHRLLRRTEHADRMRQALINENSDLVQPIDRYVMRITGTTLKAELSSTTSSIPNPRFR